MADLDRVKALLASLPAEDQRELRSFLNDVDTTGDDAESILQAAQEPAQARETVKTEWRRCGKPTCRCARQGALHGPYRVRYYYDADGKRRREHLGRA